MPYLDDRVTDCGGYQRVFVVAGEASGDVLGAEALRALKAQHPEMKIQGIGGPLMEKAGDFTSLFPLQQLAVMGLDIVWQLPRLLRLFRKTKKALSTFAPDVLLTFDTPVFSMKLAKSAPKSIRKVHVVAPEVWAWQAGRAKQMAKVLDHLCVLFPFEPPYFTRHGLPTTFVGHPRAAQPAADPKKFWNAFTNAHSQKPLLLLLPGSRQAEQQALWPLFRRVAMQAVQHVPDLQVAVLCADKAVLPQIPAPWFQVRGKMLQAAAMTAARASLVASGTATLELALAGCSMVVAYKVNALLGALLRVLLQTKHVSLPNILLQREVVPEYLQRDCCEAKLLRALLPLLTKKAAWHHQRKALQTLRDQLKTPAAEGSNVPFGEAVRNAVLAAGERDTLAVPSAH